MPHGAMALPTVPGRDWRRSRGHWSGLCRAASLLGLAPWGKVERVSRCRFSGHFFGDLNQSLSSHMILVKFKISDTLDVGAQLGWSYVE